MSDKPKAPTDPHHVTPTFVNSVVGRGVFNGVANITFSTFQFTPKNDGSVDSDPIISARLRLDLNCIHQLKDACDWIIAETLKPTNGTTH